VANVEDGHLSEETKRGDGDPFACLKDGSLKLTPTTELWADLDIPPELDQRATRVKWGETIMAEAATAIWSGPA